MSKDVPIASMNVAAVTRFYRLTRNIAPTAPKPDVNKKGDGMDRAKIQVVEEYENEADAINGLAFMAIQVGYMGGRVLAPGPGKPKWRMQSFHIDDDPTIWLPDGMKHVIIPNGQHRALGLI